ncbi:MAG: lactaldehyde reductase [Planctomycetaceae bacterium]|nr:lactaldehyde reductase [Planctomycetaceae bacterium]
MSSAHQIVSAGGRESDGFAGLVLLVVAIELQVRGVEKPYLRAVHGQQYRDYTAAVGRFVPGIGYPNVGQGRDHL